jgi:hypothetical protein
VDDRGNVYKLYGIPMNNEELALEEQKDVIPSGQEVRNEIIAGKAWASHTNNNPRRIIYWFVNEKELAVCLGGFEKIIGRFPYTYINGVALIKHEIFKKEYIMEIKIEDDKMYRENGDIYTKIL